MPSSKDILRHQIRLLRLELHDFRGFRFLDLDFDSSKPITILIADNGGGKTSVLDAVAGFLRYFLTEGIYAEKYESHFAPKDITNGEASSLCKITLELTYPFPAKELYEACRDVAEFMNEYSLNGVNALVEVNAIYGQWQLFIDDMEDGIELPADIVLHLDNLLTELDENKTPKLKPEDSIKVAYYNGEVWIPNLNLAATEITRVSYTGQIDIIFELNKSEGKFRPEIKKNGENIEEFIAQLARGTAFLEDFRESAQGYQQENRYTVLPLLRYFYGSAIHTRFGEVGIKYHELPYQAFKVALEPNSFEFEDFFEWLNWIDKVSKYKFFLVKESLLEVLNLDQELYQDIIIEEGELRLYKQNLGLSVEVSQLSAGEKNLFALIGDLVKRAIQLNPLLFELDYDPNIGSYSNVLTHTDGIVLIDEIDLHLHPKLQRMILPKLRELFPKVQFLVTTHSPFVLRLPNEYCSLFFNRHGRYEQWKHGDLLGWTIEEILSEIMGLDDKVNTDTYNMLLDKIEKALELEDYLSAIKGYNELVLSLHPASTLKKLLRLQIESIKD